MTVIFNQVDIYDPRFLFNDYKKKKQCFESLEITFDSCMFIFIFKITTKHKKTIRCRKNYNFFMKYFTVE